MCSLIRYVRFYTLTTKNGCFNFTRHYYVTIYWACLPIFRSLPIQGRDVGETHESIRVFGGKSRIRVQRGGSDEVVDLKEGDQVNASHV